MKNNIVNISAPKPSSTPKLKVLPSYKNKIAIAQGTGMVIILVADILYCQAQSSYCKIILKTGKEYLISKTLKRVLAVLNPAAFIRVHQSYGVAIDAVVAIDKGITLSNDAHIPIARSQRKQVMQRITERYGIV